MDENPYQAPSEVGERYSLSPVALTGALLSGAAALALTMLAVGAGWERSPIVIPLIPVAAAFWFGTTRFVFHLRRQRRS